MMKMSDKIYNFALMNQSLSEMPGSDRLSRSHRLSNVIWIALLYSVLLFAAAWCVWALCTPLLGDDLMAVYRMRDFGDSITGWLQYAWGVWNHTNARIGDMMVPLWLSILPRPLTALLLGVAVGGAIIGALRLADVRRSTPLSGAGALLLIYIFLPWWDMDFYVCHFNYVWGMALVSPALLPLLNGKLTSRRWLWWLPAVFIAVGTHEALAFPLGCGFVGFWLVNRKRLHLNKIEIIWLGAIFAAVIFSVSSRASYSRAGSAMTSDINLLSFLLTTLPLVLVLIARTLWLAVRGGLGELARTRWLIFAITSLVSAGFAILGHTEGRGGWYAQMFAIIALCYDYCRYERRFRGEISKWLYRGAVLVGLLCNAWVVCYGFYLVEMTGLRQTVVSVYRMNPDSPVAFMAAESLDNEWVVTCMPLVTGDSVSTPELRYVPSRPLAPGEPNPADPVIYNR